MTADAVVVAARPGGTVDLEFRPRACAACAGTCLWRRLSASRIERLQTGEAFEPGTEVTLELSERRVLLASMLLHGVPLVAILVGAAVGAAVTATDLGTLAGAAAGLALALAGGRRLGRRLEQSTLSRLRIVPKR